MELPKNLMEEIASKCYAELLLNSYYGIHSFKDKKPVGCQCEKPINWDDIIIKEMHKKMKKSANKPVVNPIEKVIFNPPATIVFWKDGSKTVVKAQGDVFNPETGLAMAISRHYLCDVCGLERYDGVFNRYLPKDKNKE